MSTSFHSRTFSSIINVEGNERLVERWYFSNIWLYIKNQLYSVITSYFIYYKKILKKFGGES